MYNAKHSTHVIDLLENQNLLKAQEDGKRVVRVQDQNVPIFKSDGTTLYLTRDIAAALDRFEKFKFDNMYYVVDNAQTHHFSTLFGVIDLLNLPWGKNCKHIKFGRIKGMSTRKGQVVFLRDILDEARDIMKQKQITSPTTKVKLDNMSDTTADILGISAVVINDLKQRKTKDYDFDWSKALQTEGDTGVKLQYTHCRLFSLEKNSGSEIAPKCNPDLLPEPEALHLINELARFDEILIKSHAELEACILVNYLFGLCNAISKALKTLQVKNQGETGAQRLLMFNCARLTLLKGIKILGLEPLNEM